MSSLLTLLDGPAPSPGQVRNHASLRVAPLVLGVACLGLATYTGTRLAGGMTSFSAIESTVGSPGNTAVTPVTGRLVFVAAPGEVSEGEVLFAIETAPGKTVMTESPAEVTVVQQLAATGARVSAGDPIVESVEGAPTRQLTAIVTQAQFTRLGPNTVADIRLIDGTRMQVELGSSELKFERVAEAIGTDSLYRITLTLPPASGFTPTVPAYTLFQVPLMTLVESALRSPGISSVATFPFGKDQTEPQKAGGAGS